MVARFGQVIPTGQAVETTEVVSQLDPSFRKVCHGMAGNRFWSARFSRMLVVRFDSDQRKAPCCGGSGARRRVRRGEKLCAGACCLPVLLCLPSKQASSQTRPERQRDQPWGPDRWMARSPAVRPRAPARQGTVRPRGRSVRDRAARQQSSDARDSRCATAARSPRGPHQVRRRWIAARVADAENPLLEAESCALRISHSQLNMLPNRANQKKYYARNMLPPPWLL